MSSQEQVVWLQVCPASQPPQSLGHSQAQELGMQARGAAQFSLQSTVPSPLPSPQTQPQELASHSVFPVHAPPQSMTPSAGAVSGQMQPQTASLLSQTVFPAQATPQSEGHSQAQTAGSV